MLTSFIHVCIIVSYLGSDCYMKEYIIDYSKRNIELEEEKGKSIIKGCSTLVLLNALLLIPLVIAFLELLKIEDVRLFTIIFGFTIIGLLIASIILALLGLILNKSYFTRSGKSLLNSLSKKDTSKKEYFLDQTINDLDSIYLRNHINNSVNKTFLFISFSLNCAAYLVLIGAVITIMIFI